MPNDLTYINTHSFNGFRKIFVNKNEKRKSKTKICEKKIVPTRNNTMSDYNTLDWYQIPKSYYL